MENREWEYRCRVGLITCFVSLPFFQIIHTAVPFKPVVLRDHLPNIGMDWNNSSAGLPPVSCAPPRRLAQLDLDSTVFLSATSAIFHLSLMCSFWVNKQACPCLCLYSLLVFSPIEAQSTTVLLPPIIPLYIVILTSPSDYICAHNL